MTKSWADVRDEACRLYLNGATLWQVQERLEARFNFKASVRSFRLHFKQWGITRAGQLEVLKSRNKSATRDDATDSEGREAVDSVHSRSGHGRAQSEPPELSVIRDLSRDSLRQSGSPRDLEVPLNRRVNILPRVNASTLMRGDFVGRTDPLRGIFQDLEGTPTGHETQRILEHAAFANGIDSILHYAATQDKTWLLDRIIDFILVHKIGIDLVNGAKRTALELAIQACKTEAVEMLLVAGASLQRRNEREQQPLHYAIAQGASVSICRILLQYGAEANAPLPQANGNALTPADMVVQQFLRTHDEKEKNYLCAVLEDLLDHGAQIQGNGEGGKTAWLKFLKAWTEWDSAKRTPHGQQFRRTFRLSNYFRAEQNPLCWFPRQYCPDHKCDSFASFIFAHTPNSGLPTMLIESSDMTRYGHALVYALLDFCPKRYTCGDDPSINDLLRGLLERLDEQGVIDSRYTGLLRRVVDRAPEPEKLSLLETLLESHVIGTSESKEALTWLNHVDTTLRMRLAELLLSQLDLGTTGLYRDIINHHSRYFNRTFLHNRGLMEHDRADGELSDQVIRGLDLTSYNVEDTECIIRCVVHVVTKSMLGGKLFEVPLTAEQRVFGATRLRQRYGLPELDIPSNFLFAVYPQLQYRHSLERAISESGPSESVDSPDTRMSDTSHHKRLEQMALDDRVESYGTPESLE